MARSWNRSWARAGLDVVLEKIVAAWEPTGAMDAARLRLAVSPERRRREAG